MSSFIASADEFERCVHDENIETDDPIECFYLLDCNNRILYDYSRRSDISLSDVCQIFYHNTSKMVDKTINLVYTYTIILVSDLQKIKL